MCLKNNSAPFEHNFYPFNSMKAVNDHIHDLSRTETSTLCSTKVRILLATLPLVQNAESKFQIQWKHKAKVTSPLPPAVDRQNVTSLISVDRCQVPKNATCKRNDGLFCSHSVYWFWALLQQFWQIISPLSSMLTDDKICGVPERQVSLPSWALRSLRHSKYPIRDRVNSLQISASLEVSRRCQENLVTIQIQ